MSDFLVKCLDSWKKTNPDFTISSWKDQSFFSTSPFYCSVREKKLYRKMSNYARLKVLYELGGIYLDTDVQLLKNLSPLLDNEIFFTSQRGPEISHYVSNGIMGATPNNRIIKLLLEKLEFTSAIDDDDFSSGPPLVTAVLKEQGFSYPITQITKTNDITLYPYNFFYPFDWETKPKLEHIKEEAYSIHWWWSKRGTIENFGVFS
jgi:mannosyltransferase OCH1-like enzyme